MYMGDDNPLARVRIDTIILRIFDGVISTIECWYISQMKKNLISLPILESQGCKFHAKISVPKVCKGSIVLMKSGLEFILYII